MNPLKRFPPFTLKLKIVARYKASANCTIDMPQNDANRVKAEKALEINPNHEIFGKLKALYADDKDTLKEYTKLLYDQALLIEGLSIDDPVEFANFVCKLMTK